jgi:uncharacterized protein YyaL (SSP411 family)
MDETTYSDERIINYINEHLIPVRVDSDMRPDVDGLYNQGGWPSTAFLTSEGDIMDGGTYIPPETMLERLMLVVNVYAEQRHKVNEVIAKIRRHKLRTIEPDDISPSKADIEKITGLLKELYDPVHGGFGQPQKFPNTDAVDFLVAEYTRSRDPELEKIVVTTLKNMQKGEIHDPVEGGFFRYSAMPDWSAPHYEKMLEGNAGIIRNYSNAYMVFGDESFKEAVEETVDYIKSNLLDPETYGLYGSQDADENYYKSKDRNGLKKPYVDKTVYADSASAMISALVVAYSATGRDEYLGLARGASRFIEQRLYDPDEGVFHYFTEGKRHLPGLLPDNILFAVSLLDLYDATLKHGYLKTACSFGAFLIDKFYDHQRRRLKSTLDTAGLDMPPETVHSAFGAVLGNFRAAVFLGRISLSLRDEKTGDAARGLLSSFRASYERFLHYAPVYGEALRWSLREPLEFTFIEGSEKKEEFLSVLNGIYIPEKVVRVLSPSEAAVPGLDMFKDSVYVCRGKRCSAPVSDPAKLKEAVRDLMDKKID